MNGKVISEIMNELMGIREGYELDKAGICVLIDGKVNVHSHAEDVYDGLEAFVRPDNAEAIILESTGRATPTDGSGLPRRVRLTIGFDGKTLATAMEFEDNLERIVSSTDEDEAPQGPLGEALAEAWFR